MPSTVKPTRVRITDAADSIRRRESFVAGDGSLSGRDALYMIGATTGRLPNALRTELRAAFDRHRQALYVVWSYGTPIAWAAPGEPLTVPAVRYSVTTSRHQGIARRADTAHYMGDGCARPHGSTVSADDWNAGYRGD